MSQVWEWKFITVTIMSLAVSAMACGLPSPGGSQADEGSTATDLPLASPTQTELQPGGAPTAESPGATTGVCANAYFPVVEGAIWSYVVTGGPTGTTSYTDMISEVNPNSFILTTEFPDLTRTQRWSCNAEGLVALDYGGSSATVAVSDLQAVFDTTQVTGMTLPASIAQGDTWSQVFILEGTQTLPGDQSATSEGDVQFSSTAGGMESITVPAGTFEALRVESTSTMEITVELSGFKVPTTIEGTSIRWYAPGVGLVRSVETSNMFDTQAEVITELTGYSLP